MASLERSMQIAEQILCDLAAAYNTPEKWRTLFAFDREHGQFLLIDEGWEGYRRIHTIWAHIELRDGMFWIHEDGTEEGIANLLVATGIPKEEIVLAFYAPNLRNATEFAVA